MRMMAAMSSGFITAPDGFEGEFRMISFVRGVTAFATISAVSAKFRDSSVSTSTGFPPA